MKSCKKNRQPSDVNFTHARNFPFIFNMKLHACAKIDVERFHKTSVVADPGFGGFHAHVPVAATPPFDAHAHRCNESGCRCFNGWCPHFVLYWTAWRPHFVLYWTGDHTLCCTGLETTLCAVLDWRPHFVLYWTGDHTLFCTGQQDWRLRFVDWTKDHTVVPNFLCYLVKF